MFYFNLLVDTKFKVVADMIEAKAFTTNPQFLLFILIANHEYAFL